MSEPNPDSVKPMGSGHSIESANSATVRNREAVPGSAQSENLPEPDSIDSLLEFLPDDDPGLSPQGVANRVLQTEMRRLSRFLLISRLGAFGLTFFCVLAGWYGGSRLSLPEERPARPPAGFFLLHGLGGLKLEATFLEELFDTTRPSVWDDRGWGTVDDFERLAAGGLDQLETDAIRKSLFVKDFDLSDAGRKAMRDLAERIESLSEPTSTVVRNRLAGIRRTLAGLTDEDRKQATNLNGKALWGFLEQKAQQRFRFEDSIRKPTFSVIELNRPDYLMDLALVTRAWNRMTPDQKRAAERRAAVAKTDPVRKTERIRLLVQSLEADAAEPPAARPAQGRNGPLQKAFAKAEALKQDREKRRSEFQKIVAGNLPMNLKPDELESFMERMPPWLVESVDPMPADEARRLLNLLKVLVGNLDEPASVTGIDR